MLNNNEEEKKIKKLKIEEIELNPERNEFENELRKNFSKEDVSHYFEVLNDNKILSWENKLFESKLPIRDFSGITDADILNEKYEDDKVARIIKGDIDRTRVQESIYMPSFKEYLYKIIVYYINKNNIAYKQGLNEIAGPFILLKYKLKLSFTRIYKLLVCFIDKFLTNYFHEREFFSLKSSFSLINLLLRYHDPELFYRFEDSLITPDLYATSWLLTLFSNKCALNVVYQLWDKLILFDDNLFPHFFITAYLIKSRKKFFEVHSTIILSILSQLHIDTIDEVNDILDFAAEIRDSTPNSFYLLADKLEIFKFDSKNLKNLYEEIKPDKLLALPIFPSDIFTITYKDLIGCPDENCQNFIIKNKDFNKSTKCLFCRSKFMKPKLDYIIFDLRLFDNESSENIKKKPNKNSEDNELFSSSYPGFLPKTITITKEELNDKNFPNNILKQYKTDKDINHFILITSETNYFDQYEKEYYKDKDRRGSKVGIFYKSYKELDNEKAKTLIKKTKNVKNYLLLKEFDNFKKMIDEMNKEGFKYVSFVYGGYKNVHSIAMKYNIDLLEHKEKCFLCEEVKNGNIPAFLKFFI